MNSDISPGGIPMYGPAGHFVPKTLKNLQKIILKGEPRTRFP